MAVYFLRDAQRLGKVLPILPGNENSCAEAFGLHLVCVWPAFGLRLACIWPALGLRLGCVWPAFGMHLICVWPAFGLRLTCTASLLARCVQANQFSYFPTSFFLVSQSSQASQVVYSAFIRTYSYPRSQVQKVQ